MGNHRTMLVATALMLASLCGVVRAQDYPAKPIRFIVPYAPAGLSDQISRRLGELVAKRLGVPVVVENRAGANGSLGLAYAARSAPDGYTVVLVSTSSIVLNPMMQTNLPFNVERDFQPIAMLARSPLLLVLNPQVPATNLKDLVAFIKANPAGFSYGSPGVGHMVHIATEMWRKRMGLDMVHVPYKGESPAITDLVAGQTKMYFGSISAVNPLLKAGRLRGVAITASARSPIVPDVPTFAEQGFEGFDIFIWFGVAAPTGIPPKVAQVLNEAINAGVNDSGMRAWLAETAQEPGSGSVTQFASFIDSERKRWKPFVDASGAVAQ